MPRLLLHELCEILGAPDLGWSTSKKNSTPRSQNQQELHSAEIDYIDTDNISTDSDTRSEHSRSASSYHDLGEEKKPYVVCYPQDEAQIAAIVEACNRHQVPVIPWGGGTALEGHLLTPHCGVSIDMCNLDSLLEFNQTNQTVRVQAGLGYLELNEMLAPHGFWFPLDPGPGATVGGMGANSCSGSTACKYGTMRENCLAVRAVLANGQTIKTANQALKTSAGYNLTNLLVGSEGTLGVITELTLRVFPKPKLCGAVLAFFETLENACDCANGCKKAGLGDGLGRCELMDERMIEIIKEANGLDHWPDNKSCLMFDVHAESEEQLKTRISIVQAVSEKSHSTQLICETDPPKMKELWMLRKTCLWACSSIRPNCSAVITDVCVPPDQLASVITKTQQDLKELERSSGIPGPIVAHTLDGNFHAFIMIKTEDEDGNKTEAEIHEVHDVVDKMVYRAIDARGTCTGEHGIGYGKIHYLERELGPSTVQAMMRIKNALDPKNVMNPGKVLPKRSCCG